jgi:hypothetical protein
MTGRPSRETVMTALFNALVASVKTNFTASTTLNSQTLGNPSTTTGLFIGLPVFGAGIPRGAVIQNLSPLTMSLAAAASAGPVALTTGFLTTGRRVKFARDVSAQPALFLRGADEDLPYHNIILQEQTIKTEVWIYSNVGEDPDAVPEIALHNLLDAVQNALAPEPTTGRFTLNGLVHWVRMVKVTKDPGDASGQAMALADVEIIVP